MIPRTTLIEIVSGQRDGLVARVLRWALGLLTPVYRLAIWFRNRKYDQAVAAGDRAIVNRIAAPVVSIGNLTTGGTGKTPLVVSVAQRLRQLDRRVALVSRGYGVDLQKTAGNDEALELEHRLPDVPHLQDADRFKVATIAVEELESEVIVLDDGFQHRQLHRDLDIVTVDATLPFGYGRLLPRGLLREPIKNIARADLVVITRSNLVSRAATDKLLQRLTRYVDRDQILVSSMKLTGAIQASGKTATLQELSDAPTFLFSGIGNPKGFASAMADDGFKILGHDVSQDHHNYRRDDIDRIGRLAQAAGASQIICTHKDLVKIGVDRIAKLPLYAVLVEVVFESGHETLDQSLAGLMTDDPTAAS